MSNQSLRFKCGDYYTMEKKVNTPVKMIKPKSVRQGQYYKTIVQQYLTLAHLTVTYSTKKKKTTK